MICILLSATNKPLEAHNGKHHVSQQDRIEQKLHGTGEEGLGMGSEGSAGHFRMPSVSHVIEVQKKTRPVPQIPLHYEFIY